jgi:hypothetical protein
LCHSHRQKKKKRLSICSINSKKEENYIEVHWNKWVARFVRDQNDHLNLLSSSVSTMIYVLWTVIVLTEHTHIYTYIYIYNVRRDFPFFLLYTHVVVNYR